MSALKTASTIPIVEHAAHRAWKLHEVSLSPDQIPIAGDLFDWLARQPGNLAHALRQGVGESFSPIEMRVLEHEIIKRFAPLPKAESYLRVLCKVVDAINHRSSQKLPTPRIPQLVSRPKNPFENGLVDALNKARQWREAIINQRRNPKTSSSSKVSHEVGLLFSSAVLHGGLVDANLLVALARALEMFPASSFLLESSLVIQLSVSWQGEAASEYRLWYPDHLTGTLIPKVASHQFSSKSPGAKGGQQTDKVRRAEVWYQIRRYFQTTSLTKSEIPTSLGMMLETVRSDFQSRIPMVLANYASRLLVSHSLPLATIERIGNIVKPNYNLLPLVNASHHDSSDLITDQNQASMDRMDIEPHWLQKYRKIFFAHHKPPHVLNELTSINPPLDSPERCFRDFASHLVSARSASGNMLAPSTAGSYLVMVAKRLGGRLGNISPIKLSPETLEDLYKEILQDADQDGSFRGLRRRIAKALREFHHFLVRRHQIPSINVRDVLGIGKGLIPVDANLITWDEYDAIRSVIPDTLLRMHPTFPAIADLGKALQLIFMLSFKCGLRRMEVLMLTCADFGEHDPAELLIRPSDARRLKTKSSTRKIPLYTLLNESDIQDLRQWKSSRLALTTPSTNEPASTPVNPQDIFLFSIPEIGGSVLTQDMVFPIIHTAMRSVTGDDGLHFHHLRHSFASWTFMRLMMSDMPIVKNLFPMQPKTSAILADSRSFRNQLYARDCMTRRHTYAVASLLGHSGPEISLEHYLHTCDILLNLALSGDESSPHIKPIRLQAARPKSTIYRWLAEGVGHVPYRMTQRTRWFPAKRPKTSPPLLPSPSTGTSTEVGKLIFSEDLFDKIWDMLFQHTFHRKPLSDLCQSNGIPLELATKMLDMATKISEMRATTGSKGYRHRMVRLAFDRRTPEKMVRIPCPEPPRTRQEKEIASRLAKNLVTLMVQKPLLCQKVFSYYLDNVWSRQGFVVFRDYLHFEPACDFIKFLEDLDIKKSQMKMIAFDQAERSRYVPRWRVMLKLSANHPIIKLNDGKSHVKAKKWLAIMPVFTNDKSDEIEQEAKGSNAFRYLMVMGAIVEASKSGPSQELQSTQKITNPVALPF
nr:tyrosine-type recombinase/integrase [Ferrovum sp.]